MGRLLLRRENIPTGLTNVVVISSGAFYSLALGCVPPVITQQPTNMTVNMGGSATFSVVATGTSPLSYQWLKNGFNLINGGKVSGANSSTLKVTNVSPSDAGIYTVMVSNIVGAVSSSYAALTVWTPISTNIGLVGWGDDEFGQIDWVPSLTNMVAIAGGGYHTLALKSDGTVVAWGGDIYSYSGETNVPSNLSNVVAIAGGGYHSLALKGDGTVAAWGDDEYGETNVPANLTNVVAIAGGGYFSLALKNDGTVAARGDDEYGETNVPSNLTNVVAISAGGDHSLASQERRHSGGLGLWPFWPDQCSIRLDKRGGGCCRRRIQLGAQERWNSCSVGW